MYIKKCLHVEHTGKYLKVTFGGEFRAFLRRLPQNGSQAPLAPEVSEVVDDR